MSEKDRMTVRELIQALSAQDPDALVLVDGYEGGFTKPSVWPLNIVPGAWGSYTGPWEMAHNDTGEAAIIISREEDGYV